MGTTRALWFAQLEGGPDHDVVRHVLLLIMSKSNYLGNYCCALYIYRPRVLFVSVVRNKPFSLSHRPAKYHLKHRLRKIIDVMAKLFFRLLLCHGPVKDIVISLHVVVAQFDLVGRHEVRILEEFALDIIPFFFGDIEDI